MRPTIVVAWCNTCGPVAVSPALAELHRDPASGFALHAFVCTVCEELTVGRCPEVEARLVELGVTERRLTCSSPPRGGAEDGH